MAESKTKEQRYEELIKAMQEGEMGMAKFLWDLLERLEGAADLTGGKLKDHQKRIDDFIKTFKDRKDGKPGRDGATPSKELLLSLITPLIKPGKDGETPSDQKLLDLIISVMPDPIPGPPGKPGKEGKRGKTGKMPAHEWNGTLIRFQNPDGSWGEYKNLQGPAGEAMPGGMGGGKTGALERVRADGFEMQGVSQIYFGENLTVTRLNDNTVRIDAEDGGGGLGSGISFETPVGDIDDSNVTFNVANEPLYIIVNGAQYFVGTGAYASYNAGVITLAYPIGVGGFIRSAYATS